MRYARLLAGAVAALVLWAGPAGSPGGACVYGQSVAPGVGGRVGKYELWGQLFTPYLQVLSQDGASARRAFQMELRLEKMTGLPKELAGARASLTLQAPDKLRLSGPVFGQEITVGRSGQSLWVAPGDRFEALLGAAAKSGRLQEPDGRYRLGDFRLPFTDKHLALLPALFQVREYAAEPVDGVDCRVLEVELMEELGKMLGGKWKLLVWVDPARKPVRVELERKDFEAAFRVERLEFSGPLALETWERGGDALVLEPARYGQLMELVVGGRKAKKKK